MTLKIIAEQMGCSIALLSQIENSNIAPSFAILSKLSKILDFKLAALFDLEKEEKETRYEIVRKGQMDAFSGFHPIRNKKNPNFPKSYFPGMPQKKMFPYLINLSGDILDATDYGDEGESYLYVMKGQFELLLDSQRIDLREGDSIYFYTPVSHRYRCREDMETTILLLKTVS